jgi:antitoxin (DNA-binding transcriptional repressor) of toxin-antitoxin stability system
MRTVSIREVSGALINEAAERQETLGITNNNVLAGVLVPVTSRWVKHLVEGNVSRILHSIERGEKEIADAESYVSLEKALSDEKNASGAFPIRRVSIRQISGKLLSEAAERGETLGITTDNVLAGVLVPVTPRWIDHLIENNISRILHSIARGENEIASGAPAIKLEDIVPE